MSSELVLLEVFGQWFHVAVEFEKEGRRWVLIEKSGVKWSKGFFAQAKDSMRSLGGMLMPIPGKPMWVFPEDQILPLAQRLIKIEGPVMHKEGEE